MKSKYLFASRFKRIGWIITVIGVILGIMYMAGITEPDLFDFKVFSIIEKGIMDHDVYFGLTDNNVFDEVILLCLLIGLILIGFSREKIEDEYISKIRLDSLLWATYLNYAILIAAIIFSFGMAFFWVLVFNVFTILIFYNLRFHYIMYSNNRLV